jgi:hypothetical protein
LCRDVMANWTIHSQYLTLNFLMNVKRHSIISCEFYRTGFCLTTRSFFSGARPDSLVPPGDQISISAQTISH